jgi:hypothetical protein
LHPALVRPLPPGAAGEGGTKADAKEAVMPRTSMLRLSPDQYDDVRARRERFRSGQIHVPERDVLAACLELLARHPRVAFAKRMSTGVTKYTDHKGVERFVRFGFPGCPDIWAMLRGSGRLMVVEVKSDRGVVSDEQDAFMQAVNGGGGLGIVARSVSELVEALA